MIPNGMRRRPFATLPTGITTINAAVRPRHCAYRHHQDHTLLSSAVISFLKCLSSMATASHCVPAKLHHEKCTSGTYTKSKIKRLTVHDDKVSWTTEWPDYSPPEYESEKLKIATYADNRIDDATFKPKWNAMDGNIDRRSWHGEYTIQNGRPQNCVGRTGVCGRGNLGRWGPNHAGDAVVTRWKLDVNGERVVNKKTGKPVLQLLVVQRVDSDEWALPGGMVDAGETHAAAVKREFLEEACNWDQLSMEEKQKAEGVLEKFMGKAGEKGQEVYRGYVDDPRNTDNAWMETLALGFHDNEKFCDELDVKADGVESKNVEWHDADSSLKLYASHNEIVKMLADEHGAHWK